MPAQLLEYYGNVNRDTRVGMWKSEIGLVGVGHSRCFSFLVKVRTFLPSFKHRTATYRPLYGISI